MASDTQAQTTPTVKVCETCGIEYGPKYGRKQFAASRACSLGCAVALGQRNRKWASREERFFAKVDKAPGHGPHGDCWLWTGARLPDGYGHFKEGRRARPAHVVSYEIANGPLPKGTNGLHACDNRPCVNPDHIFAGTHQDNMDDMVAKGRGDAPKGEAHHDAKLTESDVRAIRTDGRNNATIAASYGVSPAAIWLIKARRNWRHIE